MAETKQHKAKTKAELLAERMQQQRVGKTAFDAGKTPAVETNPPAPVEVAPQEAQETAQEQPKAEEVSKDTPVEKEPAKSESAAKEPPKKTTKAAKSTKPAKETVKPQKEAEPEKKAEDAAEPVAPARVLDRIKKRKRIEKKTNDYYQSVANIEKLAAAAEAADMSPSTFLDDILTAVFSE